MYSVFLLMIHWGPKDADSGYWWSIHVHWKKCLTSYLSLAPKFQQIHHFLLKIIWVQKRVRPIQRDLLILNGFSGLLFQSSYCFCSEKWPLFSWSCPKRWFRQMKDHPKWPSILLHHLYVVRWIPFELRNLLKVVTVSGIDIYRAIGVSDS